MAKSDVKAVTITADTVALDADGISVAAAVGNNAALVIGGALASGGAVTLSHGRIVTILSAGDDSAKSFTVTGTDVNGDAQTESITGANAGTATGSSYFLTISGISAVGICWQIKAKRCVSYKHSNGWDCKFFNHLPKWDKCL